MKLEERIAKDVDRLTLGSIDSKKVASLLRQYYGYGLTDGMNDMTEQQRRCEAAISERYGLD